MLRKRIGQITKARHEQSSWNNGSTTYDDHLKFRQIRKVSQRKEGNRIRISENFREEEALERRLPSSYP